MTSRPLTAQQRNVLAFIERFARERGFPPTLREIGEAIGGVNINAVRGHLAALEKKGYLVRSPDQARSIQVVRSPSALSRVKRKLHEVFHTDEGVFHRVVYGVVWATGGRRCWLKGKAAETLDGALDREAIEHGWRIREKQIRPDHVVIVVEVWPNHSPQQTVRRFQGAGKALKQALAAELKDRDLWARGYAVTTDLENLEELVAQFLDRREPEDCSNEQAP